MLGDGLANSGQKGSYFRYQYASLKLLEAIASTASGGNATAGNQVIEIGLLTQILAASLNGKEFEQNLVTDLGGVGCPANCPTYLQVRIWDPQTQTFGPPIYYTAAGVVVVPVGPVQLVNPQFVLDNILLQVTAINADIDVALSTRASEVTLLAINAKLNSLGQKTMTGSVPVVIASDQTAIPVTTAGTNGVPTFTNVPSAVADTPFFVANLLRRGATIFNDSTQALFVKFAAGASATSYTVQMEGNGYYEVPFGYTGIINGFWAVANGNARLTELT